MKQVASNLKQVHYITYEYDDTEEKERHILKMASEDYELLERFEDAHKVIYRKFMHDDHKNEIIH